MTPAASSIPILIGILLTLATPVALLLILVVLLRKPDRGVDWRAVHDPVLHRWRLATVVVSLTALALAVLATVVVAQIDDLGRGVLLAPVVFALVQALGIAVSQPLLARWRGRAGGVREASLETRRTSTYSSGGRAALAVIGVAVLSALSAAGWALGRADDMGRPGRTLRYHSEGGWGSTGESWGSTGPWPGSFYVVPLLILAAVLVVVTMVALRLVADRPRPRSVDDATLAADDALRATAAGRLLAGLSVGTLGSASGVAIAAAMMLQNVTQRGVRVEGLPIKPETAAPVALAVAVIVALLAGLALVQLVVPTRSRPAHLAPTSPATTAGQA